jgi:DNA-binding NarL/FixJ family response regulator
MSNPIRVVLIEDQRRTREGLAALIGRSPGLEVVGQYGSGEKALASIAATQPDVVLTDLGLQSMSGVEEVLRISEILRETPILVLTIHAEDHHVFDALCARACGYLLKDIDRRDCYPRFEKCMKGARRCRRRLHDSWYPVFRNRRRPQRPVSPLRTGTRSAEVAA